MKTRSVLMSSAGALVATLTFTLLPVQVNAFPAPLQHRRGLYPQHRPKHQGSSPGLPSGDATGLSGSGDQLRASASMPSVMT